jgi:hypothetical protein
MCLTTCGMIDTITTDDGDQLQRPNAMNMIPHLNCVMVRCTLPQLAKLFSCTATLAKAPASRDIELQLRVVRYLQQCHLRMVSLGALRIPVLMD